MDNMTYRTENLKRAQRMFKEYPGAKLRVVAYPKKRPTFMKQMGIDLSEYLECGIVHYDTKLASRLDLDDWFYLHQYLDDMETVWFVDCCIDLMNSSLTKSIVDGAVRKEMSNTELEKKYGLKERSIRYHKEKAARYLAELLP